MYRLLKPLLFSLSPSTAHAAGMAALAPVEHLPPLRAVERAIFRTKDERLSVRRMGLSFATPIGLAAGFDKNARRARALAALGFGHLELGTVTAVAQEANPEPNMFRLPADRALVNRLGFPNEGAERVAARIRAMGGGKGIGVPIGLSIGKSRSVPVEPIDGAVADYLACFRQVSAVADFVVINVSSPNTPNLRAMQGADLARALLGAVAAARDEERWVPLLVKVAPDLSNAELDALLGVAQEAKLDGVVATNTTLSRAGLATPAAELETVGAGGLSGPPLKARALEVVRRAREVLGPTATVIGVGGIETGDDIVQYLRAGANLVQLYTSFIYGGPGTARRLARELLAALDREGARSVAELGGGAAV